MTKARKVKSAGRKPHGKPHISHRKAKPHKAKAPARAEEPKKAEAKKGMAARLAAMAAASAELEEVPEPTKTKAPPAGGVQWKDLEAEDHDEASHAAGHPAHPAPPSTGPAAPGPRRGTQIEIDDEPKMAAPPSKSAAVDDGVEVVAKSASKFSMADLEVLRAAIKVKGSGTVVDGINLDELKYDAEGLVPVVAQDRRTGAVLQLGWGSKETLEQSMRSKQMVYWSREHGKAMEKGEGSGHAQRLVQMRVDCDKDSMLALVDQEGPACHLDHGTCWTDGRHLPVATFLGDLDRQIQEEAKHPKAGSEIQKLMAEPLAALKAFVEDANDVTRALQGKTGSNPVEQEAADTFYHLLVACRMKGIGLDQIVTDLFARQIAADMNKK